MKEKGYSLRNIARALNRSVSTISDELSRNKVRGTYDASKAHHKSYARRQRSKYQGMHIVGDTETKKIVDDGLYDDLSPDAIAGRINLRQKRIGISKDSIYRYIGSVYGRKIEAYRKKKRCRKRGRSGVNSKLSDRIFIDERPKYIHTRQRIGDMEGDFVVSGKGGKGVLLVAVDRKARLTFLELIVSANVRAVHDAFLRIKSRYPEMKSLTLDNDILFQKHKELEAILRVNIYFCHPYHSWEKGTVENTNKYVRRDVPKGTDISKLRPYFVASLENKLNRRPMKCLGYRTPQEMIDAHRSKKKR